jgi:dihydropteroate synthase
MEPDLATAAAEAGAYLVVTRNARPAARAAWTFQKGSGSLSEQVMRALEESLRLAERGGVARDRLIVDPGIGFGEQWRENLIILRDLAGLRTLGLPILVGPSRKAFIRYVLGTPTVPLEGTAATIAVAIAHGADMVRVHDVAAMMHTVHMTDAIVRPPLRS